MRRMVQAALVAVTIGGSVALAAPALAMPGGPRSTVDCTEGLHAGTCGTQTDLEVTPLSMVSGGSAQQNRFVYAKVNAATQLADFNWTKTDSGPTYEAEFAPNGVLSGFCVAQVGQESGLKLRSCNGSLWQQWTLVPFLRGNELRNGATGDIVQSNGLNTQLRGVVPGIGPTLAQLWRFEDGNEPAARKG